MRVALVNTVDIKGGAARAAHRLHKGLCDIGVQSTYYVRDQHRPDPTVQRFVPDPRPDALAYRARRKSERDAAYAQYAATRSPDIELFSQERVDEDENFFIQMPRADLVNLHWIAGFVDYPMFFSHRIKKPVVWTLHDMFPFTGGCHYDQGCGKYVNTCGACPLLGSNDETDLSRTIFQGKERALAHWPQDMLRVVAPSRWLAEEARKSALFGRFRADVIPYGLETDIFKPVEKEKARAALKLPRDARIVLFVSNHIRLARKGFRELIHALSLVPDADSLLLLGVGDSHILSVEAPFRIMQAEHVYDDNAMAMLYAAADITAIPSRQDNLPNTILESFCCGTPVAGFAAGGIPDAVREGETGFLARSGNTADLALAFMNALADRDRLRRMGERAREVAVSEYALTIQARAYEKLYAEMIADNTQRGGFNGR